MGKKLKAPAGYTPFWVQTRRLDLVEASDVDEHGTPVDVAKANKDLRKALNRQRHIIMSQAQMNHVLITGGTEFNPKPGSMELRVKRLPGNEDVLSVLDLQVALGREMQGSLGTQREVKRSMPDETITEANVRTYGTMIDAIYSDYHTADKPEVLGENAVARPGNRIIMPRKAPAASTRAAHYQAALKIASAWTTEQDSIREGYAAAGLAIGVLKRASTDDGNPSPKQKLKHEAVPDGEARNGEAPSENARATVASASDTAIKTEEDAEGSYLF